VPVSVRNRDRAIGLGEPVFQRYERIAFEKDLLRPAGQVMAAFVCPGHPLLESILDLTLERHRDLLRRGSVLVDERDTGTSPRVLIYLDHAIQDARVLSSGERRTISRRMLYVEIDATGKAQHLNYAPCLDYRPLRDGEPTADELLARPECGWVTRDLEHQALAHAIAHVVGRLRNVHLNRWRRNACHYRMFGLFTDCAGFLRTVARAGVGRMWW